MKTTRRQELKSNTLADELGQVIAYVKDKSQVLLVAAVAVVVLLGVVLYWRQSAQARRAEGWQTMLMLLSTSRQSDPQVLDKLEQVAGSYSDPHLKAMAYVQTGARLMDEAAVADKAETAQDYTRRAEAAFQAVLAQTPQETYAVAMARLGLGGLASNRGDFKAARGYYEAVGNDERLKGTPFPSQASAAVTSLEAAASLPPLAAASRPAEAAVSTTQPSNG